MPFSVVSLLLVLIQIFHFGGAKITPDNHGNTSLIVSRHHRLFRRTPSAVPLSWFENVEDSEKQKGDASSAKSAFYETGHSASYKPFLPLLNRIFRVFRARSNLDEQRLFLDYCNFRV